MANYRAKIKHKRKEADRLFQQVITSKGTCEVCGKKEGLAGHHIIAKSLSNALRYDTDNGACICQGCHNRLHATGDPAYFEAIKRKRDKNWYSRLEAKRRQPVKISLQFYQDAINKLKNL